MPHFNPPQNPKEADRIAFILQMKDLRLSHVYAHTPQVRGGGLFCLHVSPNSAPAPGSERTEAAQTGTLQHLRQFPLREKRVPIIRATQCNGFCKICSYHKQF